MKAKWPLTAVLFVLGPCLPLRAQEFSVDGFADLRLVGTSDQKSWLDGGPGKLGFGSDGHSGADFEAYELAADGRAQLTPDILAFASVRAAANQKTAIDILETYARYQPVTTASLRWSFRVGAFFPPISLENEGIGWTSPWTLTPSAINSWVGEELRTIGGEATIEWRFDWGSVEATGAVFGWDDPAGALIADRGWALDDHPTGLLGQLRMPDAFARQTHQPIPLLSEPFEEIDNAPGWYGEASWRATGIGKVTALEYDNRADPTLDRNGEYAWRTQFTSLGLETYIDDVTLLAQAMTGSTVIAPDHAFRSVTYFQSAYLLAGWDVGDWTLAGRVEAFATQESHLSARPDRSEHGHAFTVALTWRPKNWLNLTTELLQVDSTRTQRTVLGLSPDASETQLQLNARFVF